MFFVSVPKDCPRSKKKKIPLNILDLREHEE